MSQIKGYRQFTEREIKLINEFKELEEQVLLKLLSLTYAAADEQVDGRWFEIAREYLELGFMAANRCIAQPDTVKF